MPEVAVHCAHTKIVETAALIPNPRNPNTHPQKQIALLGKIILAHGWRNPIVVSKRSGFVVKGHGRLMAAKLAGLDKVPIDEQEYKTEADEWADMVADNQIQELSELDQDKLKDILEQLGEGFDVQLLGFDSLDMSLPDKDDEKILDEESLQTTNKCPSCNYEW